MRRFLSKEFIMSYDYRDAMIGDKVRSTITALEMICNMEIVFVDKEIKKRVKFTLDWIEYCINNRASINKNTSKKGIINIVNDIFKELIWISGAMYAIDTNNNKEQNDFITKHPELILNSNYLNEPGYKHEKNLYFVINTLDMFSWRYNMKYFNNECFNQFFRAIRGEPRGMDAVIFFFKNLIK